MAQNGNGPKFRKPLAYEPDKAASTLEKAQLKQTRQLAMLQELGLADEVMAVDDDDDDLATPTEAQSPVKGRTSAHKDNGLTPSWLYRRHEVIQEKGYDKYLSDLLGRAAKLQQQITGPAAELVDEMQMELGSLGQDNGELRAQVAELQAGQTADTQAEALLEQYEEDIRGLQARISQLESQLSSRDASILKLQQQLADARQQAASAAASERQSSNGKLGVDQSPAAAPNVNGNIGRDDGAERTSSSELRGKLGEIEEQLRARLQTLEGELSSAHAAVAAKDSANAALQAQLANRSAAAFSGVQAAGATAAERAAQVEALNAALQVKESQLAEALKEIADLKAGGSISSARRAAIESEVAEGLQTARATAEAEAEVLRRKVSQLESKLSSQEAEAASKLKELVEASEGQQAAALQKQLWTLSEQHARRVEELEAELKQKASQVAALRADAAKANEASAQKLAQAKAEATSEMRAKLAALTEVVDGLHAAREGILADLLAMRNEVFNDKMQTQMTRLVRDREVAAMRKVRSEVKSEVDAALKRATDAEEALESATQRYEHELRIKELEATAQVQHFKAKWKSEWEKRKKLHNMVLDLKGSIRVLCRVRPLLEKEQVAAAGAPEPVKVLGEESLRVATEKGDKDFEFDRVFGTKDGQEEVFEEVLPLVTTVLDGYNVCIMAYGQTGSGKTFTMEGPEANPGVNARALKELFRLAEERCEDFTYKFSASVLEIYNEQIYDLLAGGRDQDADKLDVKQGPEGMHVPGLKVEEVTSLADVGQVISRGKQNRSTFATNMNEHSSRSHLVLSLYVTGTAVTGGTVLRGKLHLIDLAGSERIGRTGAQGDRLKEAQNINKSLSALGDVIQALQQRNAHIPYRNSKLTRLLEDSLGSSSKTVMVVNVSPATENVPETKCSLEFASRARKVELGRARQNIDAGGSGASTPGASATPGERSSGGARPPAGNFHSARNTPAATPEAVSRSSSTGAIRPVSSASRLGR